jgi:LysM repeat protein
MVAQKAGKAVPAAALVGALAAGSQAQAPSVLAGTTAASQVVHAPLDAARAAGLASASLPRHVARPAHAAATERHAATARRYVVRAGDTLSGIAFQFYGQARAWHWLYQVNRAEIANPNLIFPGQVLRIPRDVPASFRGMGLHSGRTWREKGRHLPRHNAEKQLTSAPQGTLGCGSLEALWRQAGGAPSAEVIAASVAMAESGGEQYATGSVGERGYWQINPVHGALSTYDAYGNARAAVIISGDGTDWSPWTTFVDGAYAGLC